MTALEKIVKYLKSRKTGATAPEIAKYAKVNYNTVRKLVPNMWKSAVARKCRVTDKKLITYRYTLS